VRARAGLDTNTVMRMCRRLDDLGRRWAQLRNGGRLVLDWPARV
jgi:hypothetical protein